jgi:hypothetical protein
MKKIETIWHYLLLRALTNGVFRHTQQDLAVRFHMSLSTVHHALVTPTAIGAIRKESKFFVLSDPIKLLYYWASVRNLKRRIIYETHVNNSVQNTEGLALPTSIFGGFSAGKMILGEAPADYAAVYFYDEKKYLKQMQERFLPNPQKPANMYVLEKTQDMESYGQHTTLPLTFVDIWNLPDWYAKDFTRALEEKIHALLSRPHH